MASPVQPKTIKYVGLLKDILNIFFSLNILTTLFEYKWPHHTRNIEISFNLKKSLFKDYLTNKYTFYTARSSF